MSSNSIDQEKDQGAVSQIESRSSNLATLACGLWNAADNSSDVTRAIQGAGKLVQDYCAFALRFYANPQNAEASYFGPVTLRSLMEATCAVLLARVDPYRVIYAAKAQLSNKYDRARQQGSSIKWKGDFLSKDATKDTGAAEWDPAVGADKFPRALFCDHLCELLWSPAHTEFIDWTSRSGATLSGSAIAAAELPTEDLPRWIRSEGDNLYSELSKGIHAEFVFTRQTEFDADTLKRLTERTLSWVMTISGLSHFSDVCSKSLDRTVSITLWSSIEAGA